MKLVILADTHGMHRSVKVPDGDVLIHCGDITRHGRIKELEEIDEWFGSLPHKHKIFIAGNHDWCFENKLSASYFHNATYLHDSSVVIDGVTFYGSPWQPFFYDWAFNLPRNGPELEAAWNKIPVNTDVLITHGPPHGILDLTVRNDHTGCEKLIIAVERIRPKVHCFGHIHCGYGKVKISDTWYINGSNCDEAYRPVQPAIEIEI
jgi:Icc-related predicted phosphoesterase